MVPLLLNPLLLVPRLVSRLDVAEDGSWLEEDGEDKIPFKEEVIIVLLEVSEGGSCLRLDSPPPLLAIPLEVSEGGNWLSVEVPPLLLALSFEDTVEEFSFKESVVPILLLPRLDIVKESTRLED